MGLKDVLAILSIAVLLVVALVLSGTLFPGDPIAEPGRSAFEE